jgi:hypothetical protein
MKKIIPVLILIGACLQAISAQAPKAEIVDQFSRLNCDDFLARIDNLFVRIKSLPNSMGYAVIYRKKDSLFDGLYPEGFLLDTISHWKLDRTRLTIVRGEERDETEIELWVVPEGAEKPRFREAALDFTISPGRKPFVLRDNVDDGICPVYSLDLGHASEFLTANPLSGLNVVISSNIKTKEFRALKAKLLSNAGSNNIDPALIRFFRGQLRYNATVEIWYVACRRRAAATTR